VILLLYAQGGSSHQPVRLTDDETPEQLRLVPGTLYYPASIIGIGAAIAIVAATTSSEWHLGYAVYGSLVIFLVLLPNSLAYWFGVRMPFPTLGRTITYLERRSPFTAKYIRLVVGLIRPPSRL
jgi:hypothetical protein